jgi:hypothetical protein
MPVGFIAGLIILFGPASPVSPAYHIKIGRENLQHIFVIGDQDQADWYLTLAQKRLQDAISLKKAGWSRLADSQFLLAAKHYNVGNSYLDKLIDKMDVNYLIQKSGEIRPQIIY